MKKLFFIVGAKWWDKANGNTYSAAKIIEPVQDGDRLSVKVYYTRLAYGYGNAYIHDAKEYILNTLNYKSNEFDIIDGGASYGLKKRDIKNGNW